MNLKPQKYKEIPLRLIKRNYKNYAAKRYLINESKQNVWRPNKHLAEDGTIKPGEDIDYVFRKAGHKLNLAGLTGPIIGIKKRAEKGKYESL